VSFLLDNWMWLTTAATSGGLLLWPMLKAGNGTVTPQEAVQLINREKAVVVDVSTAAEFAAGHVAGARHLALADVATGKGLPSNKTLPLVLVCASGNRAGKAVAPLTQLGHARVVVLAGGLAAWREANLPTEKSA
jgi:rhodanese-related sulfurtransferase